MRGLIFKDYRMLKLPRVLNLVLASKKYGTLESRMISRSLHEFNFDSKEEIITNNLGQVILIGINLPDTKNLLTETALEKLDGCINDFECSDKLSVAILHGCSGNFCTGAVSSDKSIALSENLIKTLHTAKKPVIGALNGYTTSFGLFLAVMCDLRAMEQGSMAGIGDKAQELQILPLVYERLVLNIGLARTVELICTKNVWPASKCLSSGFISELVEHGCVLGQAISWAQSMAFNSPLKSIIQKKPKILSFLTAKV